MNFKILFSTLVLSIFLLSLISAVTVYADFESGSQVETINLGDSISFNADFFSMNPPMTMKVQLYQGNNLIQTFLNTNTNSKTYYNTYSYTFNTAGTYEIRTIGTDSVNTDSEFLTLTVNPITPTNNPPVITPIPNQQINEGAVYNYQVVATDSDNDDLTYSMSGAPSGFSMNSNGLISGAAPYVTADTNYNIIITVSDGTDTDAESYILTILDSSSGNNAPVITSSPVTSVTEGNNYNYDVDATDSDGDFVTYSIINGPGWLTINPNTGLISGVAPLVDSSTDYTIKVEASDGNSGFDTQTYTLTVKNYSPGKSSGRGKTLSEPDIYYPNRYFDQYNPDTVIYSKPTTQKILGLDILVFFYILVALISIGIVIVVFLLGKNLRR